MESEQLIKNNQNSIFAIHNNLVDIATVRIDKSKPVKARIDEYIGQVKNPYHFLCEKTPVEILFAPASAPGMDRLVAEYFTSKKAHN